MLFRSGFRKNIVSLLFFPAVLVLSVSLYLILDRVSGTVSSSMLRADFLSWRLPLVLCGGSVLLRFFTWNENSAGKDRLLNFDLFTYVAIGPAVILNSSESPDVELWTGLFFLSVLGVKTAILISALMKNAHSGKQASNLFFLALWFYSCFASWQVPVHNVSGDEPHYLLMARSLIQDADLNLYDEYQYREYHEFYPGTLLPKPSDLKRKGVIKSRGLGATFPIVLIPGYLFAGYPGAVFIMILTTAILILNAYLLFSKASKDSRSALITTLLLGGTIPVLPYSSLIYPDIISATLIISAVRRIYFPGKNKKSIPLQLTLISILLLLLKFRNLTFVLLIAAAGLLSIRKRLNQKLTFVFGIACAISAYFLIDYTVFKGDLFFNRFGSLQKIRAYFPNKYSLPIFPGILLDQEAGFAWLSPFFFLAIPGIRLWKEKRNSLFWISILSFPLTGLSLLGHFAWHSLPTPPLRYFLPILPLISLFIVQTVKYRDRFSFGMRVCGKLLISYSILISFLYAVHPAWQVNLADGSAKILESTSSILHVGLYRILPSFTRPTAFSWLWFAAFVIFIAFTVKFHLKSHPNKILFESAAVSLALLFASVLTVWSAYKGPIRSIEAEDSLMSRPVGGYYFPAKRDPFYHQEHSYGWVLKSGDALNPGFRTGAGRYNIRITARLINTPYATHVYIDYKGKHLSFINVTTDSWADFLLPIHFKPADSATLEIYPDSKCKARVAIDRIELIPCSAHTWSAWRSTASLLDQAGLKKPSFLALLRGLERFPGDPWYDFKNHFNPATLLPRSLSEQKKFPLAGEIMEHFTATAYDLGPRFLIRSERLFKFSFITRVPEEAQKTFILDSFQYGQWFDLKPFIRRNANREPENNFWKLTSAVIAFRECRLKESVEMLRDIRFNGLQAVQLLHPDSAAVYFPELCSDLRTMANRKDYRREAEKLLHQYILKSIREYHQKRFQSAANTLFDCYRLDSGYFIDKTANLGRSFIQRVLPLMNNINPKDAVVLGNRWLRNKRYPEALICAETALRNDPDSLRVRYFLARCLFHHSRFREARNQCIYAMSLNPTDDSSRTLLEYILDSMKRIAAKRGTALTARRRKK